MLALQFVKVSSGIDVFHDGVRIGQVCERFGIVFFVDLGGNAVGPYASRVEAFDAILRAVEKFSNRKECVG